jgi:hypothetical protein
MGRLARAGALLACCAALGACGEDGSGGEPSLTVYVSAPLSGPDAAEGLGVVQGARRALDDAGGEAGGVAIDVVALDSGPGVSAAKPTPQEADPVRAAANAREATQDSTAIAYVGELDSRTTATSLPITNDAGMLHVSPTADAVALVAPFDGSDEVPPETQPSGSRTFGTLAALGGDPRELGAEAMGVVLDSIERAADPLSRSSVVEAFLATEDRNSELGAYSIDDVGRADPAG